MSKLDELINELCPNGVEYTPLEKCCNILDRQRKPVTKSAREIGKYPYYGANGIQDYVSDYIFDGTFVLIGEDGSVVTKNGNPVVTWAQGKIWVNNHAHIIEERDGILLRYLYHYIQTVDVTLLIHGNIPKLTGGDFKAIPIPLPPLPVQEEIVRILDKFTELTAELTTELAARKIQYEYYRDSLFTFDEGKFEWKMLGDIGEVRMCKRILKEQTLDKGDIPFYKIGTFGKEANAYISRELFNEYKSKYNYPKVGEVLISASGTIGRAVIFDGYDAYFQDSNIVWIENNEAYVLNKYLFYFYKIAKWYIAEGGTIQRLYNENLKKTNIPIPYPDDVKKSLAEQQRIINILDRFDTLCNDISNGLPAEIKARQQQYEYYRDKLLAFKKKEA